MKDKIEMTASQRKEVKELVKGSIKSCSVCGKSFVPASNRSKYCTACARVERLKQKAANERKRRASRVDISA